MEVLFFFLQIFKYLPEPYYFFRCFSCSHIFCFYCWICRNWLFAWYPWDSCWSKTHSISKIWYSCILITIKIWFWVPNKFEVIHLLLPQLFLPDFNFLLKLWAPPHQFFAWWLLKAWSSLAYLFSLHFENRCPQVYMCLVLFGLSHECLFYWPKRRKKIVLLRCLSMKERT